MRPLTFDSLGRASLDGVWDFWAGPVQHGAPEPITVPGLWEAQGHLDLDGPAWYRRRFVLDDAGGQWTLRFGAVMDLAEVHLNGVHLGDHDVPFTPFELAAEGVLRTGENVLDVRVTDPALGDPEHVRLPHGKQGWMNHVFPSRPSLYLTYGGIWQPVELRRHGAVVLREVFVDGDPDDLTITVEVENRLDTPVGAGLGVRVLGHNVGLEIGLGPRAVESVTIPLGATSAAHWSPEAPVLHEAVVDTRAEGQPSDLRTVRFGLGTVRVDGSRILVDGEPYRMKSVLVQGFTADGLYAEGGRAEIEAEVRAAKAMGFNTLRLHIKAFDPRYLDVCDELGIFLHCDLPVAEPIAHEEMEGDTLLVQRCVRAITEQVRRDRNHPSVILWSAMNELCDGRHEARQWPAYESFARRLVATVHEHDGTRPVIENDWVEPDPDWIFTSPIVTAHWYGQLHADYFRKIEDASRRWSGMGRPFFVSEFGDWGLPEMPEGEDPPFWDTRATYAAALAETLWPGTVGRFVRETQRYQGVSDRLQTEVWRRHDDIGGYCLTELTDVPAELNGLLDLHRRPKALAVAEVARANQPVLPMLEMPTLVAEAGAPVTGQLHVSNDGPALEDVVVEVRFGDTAPAVAAGDLGPGPDLDLDAALDRFPESVTEVRPGTLPAHRATFVGDVSIVAPDVPGSHDLVLRLRSATVAVENRYPVHVVAPAAITGPVRCTGGERTRAALGDAAGVDGPLVVGEGALDADAAEHARATLDEGGVVLVLAQEPDAAVHYPVPVTIEEVVTAWGSTVFHFTTDHGALPSLPRRNLLVAEDSTVQATSILTAVGGERFPEVPAVIAFKPVPGAMAGTIAGSTPAGRGRLVFCQYRLVDGVLAGDVAARALLADLLRWTTAPRPHGTRLSRPMDDGRARAAYRWVPAVAR